MITLKKYSIRRDANTTVMTYLADYEARIISFIFGRENVVEQKGAPVEVDRDPAAEPERLAAKYGPNLLMQIFGAEYKDGLMAAITATPKKRTKSADSAAS